jgi:HK97 gp10 family phage protein
MYKSRLPRIAAELRPQVDEAIATAAVIVRDYAKARVPVETGRLHDAIHVERTGSGDYAVVAGDRKTNVFYGHIVEHGGVHHAAQPFLVPALEDSRKEILKLVAESLDAL